MKVIMPMAGYGKRMRPLTWSRPKPLLNVAGNTVLGHTLDRFAPDDVDELVFITGWLGERIQEYMSQRYAFRTRFYEQKELLGQSHAILLAREALTGPCLILYVDTLCDANLAQLKNLDADGAIFTMEVDDPRPFGVVREEQGRVVEYIEKPKDCTNRKTTVGAFWVREGAELASAIDEEMRLGKTRNGEYYLADAFNIMIARGARFVSLPVTMWQDCGQPGTMLATNRYLLDHGCARPFARQGNVIIPPVNIAESAHIEHSVIGPHVSIAAGASIVGAIVSDAIIDEEAQIETALVQSSLVGQRARVHGTAQQMNIGDDACIAF